MKTWTEYNIKTMKKQKCSICAKLFMHNTTDTLVGSLGPIPVQFCKPCFKKVMQKDHLPFNDTRK